MKFSVGDNVVYPHHGAGKITRIGRNRVRGRQRNYLTIQILHNHMTVMIPVENAEHAGLRRVVDGDAVDEVLEVLSGNPTSMPKSWSHRCKHNRNKLKTGDIVEVAEVVRNLAACRPERGLALSEKQQLTKAKRILASELMYARHVSEGEALALVEGALESPAGGETSG